jgi:hypothetical protein
MSLKESAVFSNARKRLKEHLPSKLNNYFLRIDYKTVISYLFMQCTWSTCFYFSFIYCSDILKNQFNYSIQEIIAHNLLVSVFQLIAFIIFCVMSYKISPIKILRYRLWIFSVFIVICPYLLEIANSPFYILFIQSFILIFSSTDIPAAPVIYLHFPILQRFRQTVFIYAISRLIMYTVGSFGILYLVSIFGNWGILIIMLPLAVGVLLAVNHFQKLEEKELTSP